MTPSVPITLARGDGIGPEIMDACLQVLDAAGARLAIEEIEIGEKVFHRGFDAGIEPSAWDSLRRTKVFLKAPITTPRGGGFKSLNVTTRKTLGLYANVRPCVSYDPFVRTHHPNMDVVIVRENEEDTYAGIEHRQTAEVTQCLKLISRPGCERIVRYAFEYARKHGRKKVTCFVKDNIMKLTDGLFRQVFDEIAPEYPDIEAENMIVDIGAARLADTPRLFDVLVTPNLYGDIVSDIAAQITGSVGLGGSANIGAQCAMFEAIHGSAPDIAGQGLANPSGLVLGAVMMLVHIDQPEVATRIHNGWLKTIEDGIHTGDIFTQGLSRKRVGSAEFTQALLDRLGESPKTLEPVEYLHTTAASVEAEAGAASAARATIPKPTKTMVGVDVFLDWDEPGRDPEVLGTKLRGLSAPGLTLRLVTNRGVKVYPDGMPETWCSDHWRCRFVASADDGSDSGSPENGGTVTHAQILELLRQFDAAGLDFIKTESLCYFDGQKGYSAGQGE